MLQVIGLIVACYALVRLVQVPLEMAGHRDTSFTARLLIVCAWSAGGFLVIASLALFLLLGNSR